MIDLEKNLGLANSDWLMSTREKLGLIGLLELLKPKTVLEFGYHRGGATKWLSRYSGSLITVDVNEFVGQAENDFQNVRAWNCTTQEALKRIKNDSLHFDLAIVDADHSRVAVASDIRGLLDHANLILMHDSCNPDCRKGMKDALKDQTSHAYYLDFITSIYKHDGLWGGLGLAYRSENPGLVNEFEGEISPYPMLALQNVLRPKPKIKFLLHRLNHGIQTFKNKGKVIGGKLRGS